MADKSNSTLKKALTPLHLWALAVGLVISGEYFGWNFGWEVAGTIGFLIATLFVTVLYITLVFSLTELATRIPKADGPFAYSMQAFGPIAGITAGYATLIEFLFAPPAISIALGSYVNFLFPEIPVLSTAIFCFICSTLINIIGIKESALFNLMITVLAIGELLIFFGILVPHFEFKNFVAHNETFGMAGIFAALPFAIWLYLGIEGVAMVSEEVINPYKSIPKGYILGIATLVILAILVMLLSGGIGDWRLLTKINYPLPQAINLALGKGTLWSKLFAGLGLLGLIASFHGLTIGYSRQIFALSRSGLLPTFLSKLHKKYQTPHWSLYIGAIIGILTILSGEDSKMIILSALGAVVMYLMSMLSLFKLRAEQPSPPNVYKTPLYPYFPAIALIFSLISLMAMIYYNVLLSVVFFAVLLLLILLIFLFNKKQFIR